MNNIKAERNAYDQELATRALSNFTNAIFSEKMIVTYRHYRHFVFNDDFELQEVLPNGGVTFCIAYDPVLRLAFVSYAECSLKDNFCRKTGRTIAFGRMVNAGKFISVEVKEGQYLTDAIDSVWESFGITYKNSSAETFSNYI